MEFRIFTFMQHGSLKSALISQEELDDLGSKDPKDIGKYFIGGEISEWTDHGTVEITGKNNNMLDSVLIGH